MRKNTGDKDHKLLCGAGEIIRAFRKEKKISQENLSDLTGLDRRTISKVENGISNLGFTTLHKIVTAINMPANILFYENERTDIPAKQLIIMELNDCTENELKQLFRIVTLQKSIMREKNNPKSPQQ